MQASVWSTLPISNDESGLVALSEKMLPFLSHTLSEWSRMAESHFIHLDVCLLTLRLHRLILHRPIWNRIFQGSLLLYFFSICCLFWNNFTIIVEKVKWHRESHVSYPWPESGQLVGNSVLCGGSCWNKTQMAHLPGREGTHKKTEDVGRNDSFIQTVSRQMERSQGFSMLKERVLFLNCTTLVHFQFPHTWEGLDQGR